MGLGDYLIDWAGGNPSYNAEKAKVAAIPQAQSVFADLLARQNEDNSFNNLTGQNSNPLTGAGALPDGAGQQRSALLQLAAADPQTYGAEALKATDPATMLDATIKQATAANVQADTQERLANTFSHQLIDLPDGNKARWNAQTGQLTTVYQNPYGPAPISDQGKTAYDAKRGVFSSLSPLHSAMLNSADPTYSQPGGMSVAGQDQGGMSTPPNGPHNIEVPGLPLPKETLDSENSLRTQANSDENIKTFPTTQQFYNGVKSALTGNPTNQSDFRALYSYMKLVDPGQGVRPSQFEEEGEIPGLPQKIAAMRNHLINGGLLGDGQRQDMMSDATNLYRSAHQSASASVDRWQKVAQMSGMTNPERVIPHFEDTSPQAQISKVLPKLKASDPRVIATAKKYGQTPEQVIANLAKAAQ